MPVLNQMCVNELPLRARKITINKVANKIMISSMKKKGYARVFLVLRLGGDRAGVAWAGAST